MAGTSNQPLYLKIIGTLITVVAVLIYADIQKMKSDIQTLLLAESKSSTKSEEFERRILQLEQRFSYDHPIPKDPPTPQEPAFTRFLFTNDHKFNIIPSYVKTII